MFLLLVNNGLDWGIWISCYRTLILFPSLSLYPMFFFFCTFALQPTVMEYRLTNSWDLSAELWRTRIVTEYLYIYLTLGLVDQHTRVGVMIKQKSVEGLDLCLALWCCSQHCNYVQ